MRGEIAPDIPEPSLYPPPFGDPPTKKPLPGGLAFASNAIAIMATATQRKAKPASNTEKATSYLSVGALFTRESGDFTLQIDEKLLELLNLEVPEGTQVSLVCKNKVSKSGREYHSLFLAFEEA